MSSCLARLAFAAGAVALSVAAAAQAAELDSKAVIFKTPDQFVWADPTDKVETNRAVLYGDPEKPGLYVVLNKWLPGNMSRPHWHPNDRIITVIKGTWWVGTGDKFEPDTTVPVPTGSTVIHYGKEVHYDGVRDAEVWLLMSGEGPETATPASTPPPAH